MNRHKPRSASPPGSRRLPACWWVVPLLLVATLQACTVKLIADYDEQTDRALASLHRRFETFFLDLTDQIGTPAALYDNHQDFYKDVKVAISALKLRTSVRPKNEMSLQQIQLLEHNIALLEDLHQAGLDSIEIVAVIRADFNTAITNILRLELAKKRAR